MNRPKIVAAAIRYQDKVYSLPPPARHHDIIYHICKTLGLERLPFEPDDQGFLDESGKYLMRKAALLSAKLNNQIKKEGQGSEIIGGQLYSENLW